MIARICHYKFNSKLTLLYGPLILEIILPLIGYPFLQKFQHYSIPSWTKSYSFNPLVNFDHISFLYFYYISFNFLKGFLLFNILIGLQPSPAIIAIFHLFIILTSIFSVEDFPFLRKFS